MSNSRLYCFKHSKQIVSIILDNIKSKFMLKLREVKKSKYKFIKWMWNESKNQKPLQKTSQSPKKNQRMEEIISIKNLKSIDTV